MWLNSFPLPFGFTFASRSSPELKPQSDWFFCRTKHKNITLSIIIMQSHWIRPFDHVAITAFHLFVLLTQPNIDSMGISYLTVEYHLQTEICSCYKITISKEGLGERNSIRTSEKKGRKMRKRSQLMMFNECITWTRRLLTRRFSDDGWARLKSKLHCDLGLMMVLSDFLFIKPREG